MVPFTLLWPLCLFLSFSQSQLTSTSSFEIVERLPDVPKGWTENGVPPPPTLMRFHMAIRNDRMAEFEQRVVDISTPGNQLYGQHMARDEVKDFLRPSDDTVEKLFSWMKSENVSSNSVENHGNWITFTVPVSQAEQMLKTRFHYFHNNASQETAVRTLEYSVPQDIHDHVQMIQPTIRFGHTRTQQRRPDLTPVDVGSEELKANCSMGVTPPCLQMLYGFYDTKARPDPRNKLGISGFLDQYARYDDFRTFMRTYASDHTDANFSVVSINGGLNNQNSSLPSTKASLDIQYALSLAYHTNATYYLTGGRGPFMGGVDQPSLSGFSNEPYLEQLRYLLDLPDEDLPAVLSTSYGEYEQIVPMIYANVTCNMFAQLGARGVSVIFASGDSGVGGSCVTNNGTGRTRSLSPFPATCPFVTSVGGTYGANPEKAAGFSGGGFSELFQRPTYQDKNIQKYFGRLGDRWNGLYNPNGRGVPDVAAQAKDFVLADHGHFRKLSGTSAATPVFAAIVSRLNAARLEKGQSRMGFLNPWLYSLNQTGFTDIVDGGSIGCTGRSDVDGPASYVPHVSWNATAGWDPVTGLGTPNLNTLIKVACSTKGQSV